jgi:hypothetical protein
MEAVREKLLKGLEGMEVDHNRYEQEVIFYIEKLDVNEEKVRLTNHLKYFRETMNVPASGKKLGFIAQEMGREINTLGSKSNYAPMQQFVVEMKDELEKSKSRSGIHSNLPDIPFQITAVPDPNHQGGQHRKSTTGPRFGSKVPCSRSMAYSDMD